MGGLLIEGNDGGLLRVFREKHEGQLQVHKRDLFLRWGVPELIILGEVGVGH